MRVLSLASVLLLLPFTALAQGQAAAPPPEAGPPPDPFGEVIDVRVVNVEAVVTDRDGNRVTGLAPDDFRLFVDGEEVAIQYFTEIVGGEVVEREGVALPGIPAAAPGEEVGTSYLVFVDDYFSQARDRDAVLASLADQLDFLGRNDRMAVVAFDGKRVEMLTSWTASERELRRALGDARARPALGLHRLAERRAHDSALSGRPTPRSGDAIQWLHPEDRVFGRQVEQQVERSVAAATAALRGFARPPGRKVMLLLSGGWPYSPAVYASGARGVIDSGELDQGRDLYAPLTTTANLLGYTLYPVDVPGLEPVSGADADQGGRTLEPGFRRDPEGRFAAGSFGPGIARERSGHDTLYHLAERTGGRALVNAGRLEALAAVAEDTRSYYWLGFSPERREDDRRHEIRVEVVRPALVVRTRDDFLDLSRDAERTMAVESALLFGEPAAEGALPVEVADIRPAGRREMRATLKVRIPLDDVTFVPQGEEWIARVELRAAALDAQNRESDVPSVPVEMRLPGEPPPGAFYTLDVPLELRRVRQTVVVTVTDTIGGHSLTSRVEVEP
ncbi:MAG TPA: VWA domain-containing protein [Thermoanaerobaculia bacterium]|nr:VWA domain-containing protein [Thermoanaerobaculia bacterium]